MTLGGKQTVLSQFSSLLVSNHMQSETPLKFLIDWRSASKIIEQIMKSDSPLSRFDFVFEDFTLVLRVQWSIALQKI